jgi:neutral ceramidase
VTNVDGYWSTILTETEWDTKFLWVRTGGALSATSECILEWSIGETISVEGGVYRMHVYGTHRKLGDSLETFEGVSSEFNVI